MKNLDEKQKSIIDALKRGELVAGPNRLTFSAANILGDAMSCEKTAREVFSLAFGDDKSPIATLIKVAVKNVVRELAAKQLGFAFVSDAEAAEPKLVHPIENFSITIKSITEAEISYTIGDADRSNLVGLDVHFDDGEEQSCDSPGAPATAGILGTFGMDIAESHEWTKYLHEHGIEIEKELIRLSFDSQY